LRRTSWIALACIVLASRPDAALRVDVLRSTGSLPPHIVGTFEDSINFQQDATGTYFVFDRRGHTVHTVDTDKTTARKVLEIGQEDGRVIQPTGFDVTPDGRFVVADVPRAQQRVQTFDREGKLLTGFFLPGTPAARVIFGNLMLNGAGSVQHTGETLLISHPEGGALVTEYSPGGYAQRSIGRLRVTGFEDDRDVHIAMNAGLPLVDPTGGFYYVFIAGKPIFRKYSAAGTLVFERHIEGRELDVLLEGQPTRWPRRRVQDREVPLVTPVVRAARVSPSGELWVSLAVPYTYVYNTDGDKIRTVQFSAAGIISPTSLFFSRGRLLVTPGCYEFDPR
jgi:DNA-binding beta-propeller fold protein YncE